MELIVSSNIRNGLDHHKSIEASKEKMVTNNNSNVYERIRNQDLRFPLFLGFWKRSIPHVDEVPTMDNIDEPHVKRKIVISEKYPKLSIYLDPIFEHCKLRSPWFQYNC